MMQDTLTSGTGPSAENESHDDQLMGSLEVAQAEDTQIIEAPTPVTVEKGEPTTAELNEQFEQPAVEEEDRNTTPPETNRVRNSNIINLRDGNKSDAPSERLNNLYAAAEKGDLVHTEGQTPAPTIVDHPTPTENSAGEPVAEVQPQKRKRTLRHPIKGEIVK